MKAASSMPYLLQLAERCKYATYFLLVWKIRGENSLFPEFIRVLELFRYMARLKNRITESPYQRREWR
jgi:hypothetical protein